MILQILLLCVGFVLLVKGADFFVEGSSSIATRFHIPSLIIGLTIVAMGTSLPECAVSITASMEGNNALAVANAVGSNIFNLMVVCGISALFVPIAVQVNTLKREFPFSVLCAILLMILGYFGMILGHIDGIVLLILFVGYIVYMIVSAKKEDIDKLSIKKLESVIFDLTDDLGKKDITGALQVLQNLIYAKEPLAKILVTLYNHFKKLYITKMAMNNNKDLASSLKLKPNQMFLTTKYKVQSKYFNEKDLRYILQDLCDLDYNFKNGRIDLQVGMETVLCRYCS